mgnify:CR=1 FL=1|tara:strand:- start:993 stop:2294 length:1302 start_codon:yes stop_codon:yes gene_type:complete
MQIRRAESIRYFRLKLVPFHSPNENMSTLTDTTFAKAWLKNFALDDRETAILLLDRLMLVGASTFKSGLIALLDAVPRTKGREQPHIAIYAEREVAKTDHTVKPFFPGSATGRAVGDGIPPVDVDPSKQDVGSEGEIAALISKYCKLPDRLAVSHPGPDLLRTNQVKSIVIVTDFIGSGRRIGEMLDAFARVASIQSWISYGLLDFHVVCYSGTEYGVWSVERHSLRPIVSSHIACPVVEEAFHGSELGAVKLLCKSYPKPRNRFPFGFNNTGSLIAFSHGIPNNAPALFHSTAGGWKPLFAGRSTLASGLDLIASDNELIAQNSERVLKLRNARRVLRDSEGEEWTQSMLVLDAINRGGRTVTKLSALSQLPISVVKEMIALLKIAGWVTSQTRLTRLGRRELQSARRMGLVNDDIVFPVSGPYFPTQLRAP